MRWIDRGLSVLLILAGVAHTYGVMSFFTDPQTLFWSLVATILIFLIAAVNLLPTWRPGRRAGALIVPAIDAISHTPSTRSVLASAMTFTKPSVSRLVFARLLASIGNLPT